MTGGPAFQLSISAFTPRERLQLIVEEILKQTLAGKTVVESNRGSSAVFMQSGSNFSMVEHLSLTDALTQGAELIGVLKDSNHAHKLVMVVSLGYVVMIWPAAAMPGRSHQKV